MKIHYNTAINDRKAVAQQFAEQTDTTATYDKHTKTYVVRKVRFLRHGIIEGTMNKWQVDELSKLLRDWEFADAESKAEYEEFARRQNGVPIQDEPIIYEYELPPFDVTEDAWPEEEPKYYNEDGSAPHPEDAPQISDADGVSMTVSVSREGITEEVHEVLTKLIKSHKTLISKAFGTAVLMVTYTDDAICFPWFRNPNDEEEQTAYYDFINHLIEKAKRTKIVYEPITTGNDEKYVFSKFLYRLGIDGVKYRKTRAVLMRNLDGAAWKNLTWKKRKAERELTKGA